MMELGVCRDQRKIYVRPRGELGAPNDGKPNGKETEQAIEKGFTLRLLLPFGAEGVGFGA